MAKGQRSPFGELVYRHRRRLGLTQLDLATRATRQSPADLGGATVSERTVIALERRATDPAKWTAPRPSTVSALAAAFRLEPDTEPYLAFLAAATHAAPESSTPVTLPNTFDTPLFVPVGREPHLDRLRAAVATAVASQPGVVLIGADPGVGKTALLAHAALEALDWHDGLVVLWGECGGRSGAADPHQPFRQIMSLLVGESATAGPHRVLSPANARRLGARALGAVRHIVSEAPSLVDRFVPASVLREQVETADLDRDAAATLKRGIERAGDLPPHAHGLNELVFRVVARYAETGPVVLVLEDLHWADLGTATMLHHLIRRLREQRLPILVLGTYRPSHLEPAGGDVRHALPPVLEEVPRLFDDALLDLSSAVGGAAGAAFTNAMVARMLPAAPATLGPVLFEQTAGLPLFVVAMLRWYQVDGLPRSRRVGEGVAAWDVGHGHLPAEIDTLFAGLIGRLPPDLPPLLEAASVQGATFSADVVMQVLGLSRASLIEKLDAQLTRRYRALAAAGVTTVAGQRNHDYQFAHALLRDYLYDRLTELERRHHHAATAEAMLALYGPGQHDGAGRIAFHFDRAGERQQAAAAYLQAGGHAMDNQDYSVATRCFARIGELDLRASDPFAVAQALVGLGNCARGEGDITRAARLFERARRIARLEALPIVEANSLTSIGMLDFDAGRMREGSDRLGRAIEVLVGMGEMTEACRSLALLSHTLHGCGRYDDAVEAAQRAIDLAHDLRNDMFVVNGMIALANCRLDLGRYAEAIAMYEAGIVICNEHGNLHRATICRLNIALCHIERGAWDDATAALAPVFAASDRLNDRLRGAAGFYAGLVAEGRGNLREAHARFETSRAIRVATGQDAHVIDSLAGLLGASAAAGDLASARLTLARLRSRTARQGPDGIEHFVRLALGLAAAHDALGQDDEACRAIQDGVAFVGERAGWLADPADRASYLATVPTHRALLALARDLGLTVPAP